MRFMSFLLLVLHLCVCCSLSWLGTNELVARALHAQEIHKIQATGWDQVVPICHRSFSDKPLIRVRNNNMRHWDYKLMSNRQIEVFCRKDDRGGYTERYK